MTLKNKYTPLNLHIVYILMTVLFSFFGPRVYINYDKIGVAVFIAIYLFSITFGYYWGVNSKLNVSNGEYNKERYLRLFRFSLNISLIVVALNTVYQFSIGRISINLMDMGANYVSYYEYYYGKKENEKFTLELLFLIFGSVPKYLSLVFGFFMFNSLGNYKWRFIGFLIILIISHVVTSGNQKTIGDIFIIWMAVAATKFTKLAKKEKNKVTIKILVYLMLLLALLSFSQFGRLESRNIGLNDINEYLGFYNYIDGEHTIFKIFGSDVGLGLATFITGYLSGGYYGLSLCLAMPFEWSYGIGNSVSLSTIANYLFNINPYDYTYLYRMEEAYGISGKQAWHTIFPWIASDVSFYGVPFIFIFLAFIYGKSWREVIVYGNPNSFSMFALLTIMFVFVVANNQIMHGYDYFIITIAVSFFYLNRNKRNY